MLCSDSALPFSKTHGYVFTGECMDTIQCSNSEITHTCTHIEKSTQYVTVRECISKSDASDPIVVMSTDTAVNPQIGQARS